jgi:replication factor C small subunit
MIDLNTLVWAEYYRPKTVSECILPEATKKMVVDALAIGNIPHFVFAGKAGTGKTSLARAIANEVDGDLLYINCSLERSIDVIRSRVVSFSSTVSFSGNVKIILLDEIEGMSQDALNSLKGLYEEFPSVRYIATTNHLGKVIEPIRSRSVVVDFKINANEKAKLATQMLKRVIGILKERDVKFEIPTVAAIVNKYFPDFRRTLNEVQQHSSGGSIDPNVQLDNKASYKELAQAMFDKDFKAMRKWVGENSDVEPAFLFKELYDNIFEYFEAPSTPTATILLADYQFKGAHSVDQQINTSAFLTELVASCTMKAP